MGLATAQKLAGSGQNIIIVHRDRRSAMKRIEPEFDKIRDTGVKFIAINQNALSDDGRQSILCDIADQIGSSQIDTVLHSIALGNLRRAAPTKEQFKDQDNSQYQLLGSEDFSQTIAYMGFNLLLWVQDLFGRNMLHDDCRVIGLTSEGNTKAWDGYAAVSAAKCTLESISRTIAKEFGPHGIKCNIIQAGITDTPALRLIPGHEAMVDSAVARNPLGRLTTPEDVANAVFLLTRPEASWINGALLHVDGGEHIS
ncbi:MAG: SDR family oxidoreductase [Pseudobacteriovorax sp.]|nr:SDR family oxidoreductase [Pseudobacteriovorax sp.]